MPFSVHIQWVGSRVVSSYVKEVRLELRSTEAFVMRLLEDMIQVREGGTTAPVVQYTYAPFV